MFTKPKIKVCGITTVANAVEVAQCGVDWLGLNFVAESPRCITIERARDIVRALPASCEPVGLFVNRSPNEVLTHALELGLATVQLSGDEPVSDLIALASLRVVKSFRIGGAADIEILRSYLDRARMLGVEPFAALLDARDPRLHGGTGRLIADEWLEPLEDSAPDLGRIILAGGLTPENVAERVLRLRPWMVDVASGVETSPGVKDPKRVAAFVRAARSG